MMLPNYYWAYVSKLPKKFCDDVIQLAINNEQFRRRGLIGHYSSKDKLTEAELADVKSLRDSDVMWLSEPWIYHQIVPFVKDANYYAGWNFEFSRSEDCQFTIYEPGQFYDWHCDSKPEPYKEGNSKGLIRKLSVTVTLSDPSEYEGGELEFDLRDRDPREPRNIHTCTQILPKGSLVVFPSFVWHRVRPVTRGRRLSLVIWNLGHPYK